MAAATMATLSLAGTPAFAHGVHLDFGLSGNTSVSTSKGSANVDTSAKAGVNSERFAQLKAELKAKHEAHADANVRKPDVATAKARIKNVLQRTLNMLAKYARHACSGDATKPLAQCMDDMKAGIKADISAMIDVAFTVNDD